MTEPIRITVNDCTVEAQPACSVAAWLMRTQGLTLRTSVTGEPRGPLCGMGVCFECRVIIDGTPHQRACMTMCQDGRRVHAEPDTKPRVTQAVPVSADVVVLGAGPAGIAAAVTAAEAGRRVVLVDDNPQSGGQIWRHDPVKPTPRAATAWLSRLAHQNVDILANTNVVGPTEPRTLLAVGPAGPITLRFERMILACGARERFVPFPGWTLPGVFGAGGLQALVKAGYDVSGRKIIVAGSGPLLLAVAAYLRDHGADVRLVAEQTSRGKLLRFGASLLVHQPAKAAEAVALRWRLRAIPYQIGCWPTRCDGDGQIASVTLTDGATTWTETCDALACGFGLVPNIELPVLLGCTIQHGFVSVDEFQSTTLPGVFAVGELTGIGGLDKALIEGQIAGWAATEQTARTRSLVPARKRARRFTAQIDESFALRDELRHLAQADTIVCRCEDVPLGTLKQFASGRDAKLQTRCGMGPCQGRICGPALQFLLGWAHQSIRPPIFPTALGNLLHASANPSTK